MNADSISGSLGELLGANVLAYCKNNSINTSDSTGYRAEPGGGGGGGGADVILALLVMFLNQHPDEVEQVDCTADAIVEKAEVLAERTEALVEKESTTITKYDPKFAAQQLIKEGKTTASSLKSMVAKGSVNTFKPIDTITEGYKFIDKINDIRVEIKWHSPDLNAATKFGSYSNSGSGWTAQIKIGNRLLGQDLNFYKNPSNITHIPLLEGVD